MSLEHDLARCRERPTISASEYRSLAAAPKKTKYRSVKTTVDGISFDSKGEANYWFGTLKPMERAGEIFDLQRQVRIPLVVNGIKVCTIVPDFRWLDAAGTPHYADWKGHVTTEWTIKAKLFKALIGSEIQIVRAA